MAMVLAAALTGPLAAPAASQAASLPTLSINNASITEGNAGTLTLNFTVTQAGRGRSSVHYATADGTAKSPADYLSKSGTLKFSGGHRKNRVSITIVGDTLDEPNEQFYVRLSNPVGATITNGEGVGTIIDNDAPPTVSVVATLTVPEGNSGDMPFAVVDVSLSAPSGRHVSVDYMTADGSATAGSDYVAKAGTLDFAAGQTLKSVLVQVIGDSAVEGDETFNVDLANPVNATLGTHPTVITIQDNDSIPAGSAVLDVAGQSVREGTGGTKILTFTVTRSGETTTAVNVDYRTDNYTATAPSDYVSVSGNLVFAANVTSATVQVQIKTDGRLEHRERFLLSLLNPSAGAVIANGQASGYIRDDDTWTRFTSVRKASGRIWIRGRLSPAHPFKVMVVTLSRMRNGVWVLLAVHRPKLAAGRTDLGNDGYTDSPFHTSFARPRAGQCRLVARFPGDRDHGPSRTTRRITC